MSIELIIVIIVLLVAVGIAALRKVRTGSLAPWWWRGKGGGALTPLTWSR